MRYRHSYIFKVAVMTVILFVFAAVTANAEVLFYEGFDVPAGTNLTDVSPSVGGSGTWSDNSSGGSTNKMIVRANGSPVYQDWAGIPYGGSPPSGYPETGGFLEGEDRDDNSGHILLDSSVTSTFVDGGVTWVSFVAAVVDLADTGHHKPNLAIGQGQLRDDRARECLGQAIGAGVPYNDSSGRVHAAFWSTNPSGDDCNYSNQSKTKITPQQLIIMKIQWSDTGNDTVSVANFDLSLPYLGLAESDFDAVGPVSMSADLDQSTFDTLSFHGTRMNIDEIRIATTFDDVVGGAFVSDPYEVALVNALTELKDHVNGTITLSGTEIAAHKATIDDYQSYFETSEDVIVAAFDYVATYDAVMGPLWVDGVQRWPDWDQRLATDDDIDWVTYHIMQYIIDYTYTEENLAAYESLLGSFKFGSADHFPGHVDPPVDPNAVYSVVINASFPKTYGHDTMHWADRPARKCTGAYVAPGAIVTVTVPSSMVNAGYEIRVGAHSLDVSGKPFYRRLGRSSLAYDITSTETKVTSPLGGGIYIEVPYLADAGVATLQIKNTVRGPYYSYNTVTGHMTTLSEWQNTARHNPAPWADFQTEKFIMQVPTSWIYALDDPVTLMADWDKAIDACNDLMGFDHDRGKESSYDQVDVIIDAGAYSPGYPTCNNTYDPWATYNGNVSHYLLTGPQNAPSYHFHELGHGYLFQKFPGEVESNVNLLHVPVWNRKFGYDLDTAFRASAVAGGSQYTNRTLDTTAICWMMCQNFKNNLPMSSEEKAYQLKGHAKFVDIARLFGWDALGNYWRSFNDDYEDGISWSGTTDSLLLRMCRTVGYDIRPLFHFWGIYPSSPASLQASIDAEGIPASNLIYDLLVKYKTLVPADNDEYKDFAYTWWNGRPDPDSGQITESEHGLLWDTYDQAYAELIRNNVQYYIDLYFPTGRPYLDLGNDKVTWSGQPVSMNPVFKDGFTPTSYIWTGDPSAGVVFTPNASAQAPAVTITKSAGGPVSVAVTLTAVEGTTQEQDTMMIDVYDDVCKAAIGKGLDLIYPSDVDGTCSIDLRDLAFVAADWLDDGLLSVPIKSP